MKFDLNEVQRKYIRTVLKSIENDAKADGENDLSKAVRNIHNSFADNYVKVNLNPNEKSLVIAIVDDIIKTMKELDKDSVDILEMEDLRNKLNRG